MITLEVKYKGPTDRSCCSKINVRTIYGVERSEWKSYNYDYAAPCPYNEAVKLYIYTDSTYTGEVYFVAAYIGDSRKIYIQVWAKSADTITITKKRG